MSDREQGLEQIVALARQHGLSSAEIGAALAETRSDSQRRATGIAGRVLAALGGILVLAGISVLVSFNWDAFNSAARIIITLGTGIAVFVIALLAMRDEKYRATRTPLFLVAAALQPIGMLVAMDELFSAGDWRQAVLITAGVMLLQQGAVFWQYRTAVLLSTTIVFSLGFLGVGLELLDARQEYIAIVLGAGLVGLSIGLRNTVYRPTLALWYVLGTVAFYGGLFTALENTPIDLLYAVVACGGLVLSTYVQSRIVLFGSTIALLGYIGYFTDRYFVDSIGWPLALIMLGLILVGLSLLAVRLDRRHIAGK